MCTTPDRMDEAKYQMQRQGWHKAPQWLVTPEEIAKMHPLLKMDDVLGGLFNPGQFYGILYMYAYIINNYNIKFYCCIMNIKFIDSDTFDAAVTMQRQLIVNKIQKYRKLLK